MFGSLYCGQYWITTSTVAYVDGAGVVTFASSSTLSGLSMVGSKQDGGLLPNDRITFLAYPEPAPRGSGAMAGSAAVNFTCTLTTVFAGQPPINLRAPTAARGRLATPAARGRLTTPAARGRISTIDA